MQCCSTRPTVSCWPIWIGRRCPEEGWGILEIKTASYHSAPQWEEGIPVAYQCQVLHQLAVTGHDWADVAVLIGGQDFRIYRVNRDEDKIADLIARETVFWQHVVLDTQPARMVRMMQVLRCRGCSRVTMARPSTCRNRRQPAVLCLVG
jgi:hypothetical protein